VVDAEGNSVGNQYSGTNIDFRFNLVTDNTSKTNTQSEIFTSDVAGQVNVGSLFSNTNLDKYAGDYSVEVEVVSINDPGLEGNLQTGDTASTDLTVQPDESESLTITNDFKQANAAETVTLDVSGTALSTDAAVDTYNVEVELTSAPDGASNWQNPELNGNTFSGVGSTVSVPVDQLSNDYEFKAYTASHMDGNTNYELGLAGSQPVVNDETETISSFDLGANETATVEVVSESDSVIGLADLGGSQDTTFGVRGNDSFNNIVGDNTARNLNVTISYANANNIEDTLAGKLDGSDSNTVDLNSDSSLSATSETAEGVTVEFENNSQTASSQVDLANEAFNLNEGYQILSVPTDINGLYYEESQIDRIVYYNNTDSSPASYESSEPNLASTGLIHHGHYVDAASSDARIGIDYKELNEGTPTTDGVDLQQGWNLLGTNVNVSTTSPENQELATDLANIQNISDINSLRRDCWRSNTGYS
jgi:hypothetical protein